MKYFILTLAFSITSLALCVFFIAWGAQAVTTEEHATAIIGFLASVAWFIRISHTVQNMR
jgi:hypothetical protein